MKNGNENKSGSEKSPFHVQHLRIILVNLHKLLIIDFVLSCTHKCQLYESTSLSAWKRNARVKEREGNVKITEIVKMQNSHTKGEARERTYNFINTT